MLWWVVGGVFIWGFLALLWPLSYMPSVITTFYLTYYQIGGIQGGLILTAVTTLLFLVGATQDSTGLTYAIIYLLLEPTLYMASARVYPNAYKYYIPTVV